MLGRVLRGRSLTPQERQSFAIPPVLRIVSLVIFASTLFSRAVDPVIPKIAADLAIDVKTAALLSSAFTFPYALMQPALGTIGDFFGKTRLMNISLAAVVTTTLICAFASNFTLLVTMRVIAGVCAGGIFPVGVAIVGDLVPVHSRQVAIGRLLAVGLTGNLIGAVISGAIGDLLGWRGVFFSIGGFGAIVAVIAFFAFRGLSTREIEALQSQRRGGRISQRVRRSAGQSLLQLGVLRGHRHPRHVSLCGAIAARRAAKPIPPMPASSSPRSASAALFCRCRCRSWWCG